MKKRIWVIGIIATLVCSFRLLDERETLPAHFPKPVYDFRKNPADENKILLGRALFYDPVLSLDSTISCASCHSPFNAFAHSDHALSHGIQNRIGTRNAPALMNLAWQSSFMWDGAVNHLDVQPLAPITNEKEMAENIAQVVKKLQRIPLYPRLFYAAYGDSTITGERVMLAMAQFQLSLVSAGSRYDSVMAKQAVFTPQEQNGYRLFRQFCNSCHREPLFSTYAFRNNGLPVDTTLNDYGKYAITHRPEDSLLFKIPTLRNIEYTYPYMHDGRFRRLSQVLDHYTGGIVNSSTLAPELQKPVKLSENEKVDIIAFLLTLSDRKFVFDPAHAYPREIFSSTAKVSR